jgi:hypothetical protein
MFSLIGHRFLPEADLPLHAQNRRLLDAEKGIGGPACSLNAVTPSKRIESPELPTFLVMFRPRRKIKEAVHGRVFDIYSELLGVTAAAKNSRCRFMTQLAIVLLYRQSLSATLRRYQP